MLSQLKQKLTPKSKAGFDSPEISSNTTNKANSQTKVSTNNTEGASFTPTPFNPPFWLTNPHLQTILPKFFAPKAPTYRREIIRDSLDESDVAYDFYDAHPLDNSQGQLEQTPLVVLFHGMEGSSDSHYARALAHQIHAQGWHFVVAHFRSCGGIPASGRVFYNAGDTDEVHHMLQTLNQKYENIYTVGVSLGGNALAKYMGEYATEVCCKGAVAISSPVDMSSAAMNMQSFLGQKIYTPYLLNPIIKKALKNEISDEEIEAIKKVDRISDFDHIFTAPRHGYRSNNDYYRRASALPYLIDVAKPLLLISAMDDPFIGFTATKEDVSKSVTLIDTDHGGHIGYLRYLADQKKFDINWIPETVVNYFKFIGIANQS
ncbi:YheT family hydrolase [Psychrobacter phenylpyruvicus]|uniref:Putative hydrolase n=1 Tax=Psychrobacter phenylpyruvicus TaxID=29432 RepID=A0A379LN67_9GAMM|nr:alpha/beta fold hydrolase [Psychrobacter phenylpyruvicus]SUD92046.1 putative hydrolase [Psychrobacter phenylpyruvicus]